MSLACGNMYRSALLLVLLAATSLPHELRAVPNSRSEDQCHAKHYSSFIGKPVEKLEQAELPNARFVCSICAATADVIASRLTVIYSERSKRILKMFCQ